MSRSPPSIPNPSPKHFAEHKRNEVQDFVYDEAIHELEAFETAESCLEFLGIPEAPPPPKPSKIMTLKMKPAKSTFDNFVQTANKMAKSMKQDHFPDMPLLVFKSTRAKRPRGHVADTQCQPDIVAAFDWAPDDSGITIWPCIRLAGEKASQGKSEDYQEKQAISYLHYLLLSRPDLHVAQGLLASGDEVTFLFGIEGYGVRSFAVRWSDDQLHSLMYAFIYRLYEPGSFADPSYVNMAPNWEKNLATYTVRIMEKTDIGLETAKECPDFQLIYASTPFVTRTHILLNPRSRVTVDGKPLTILKDQLCRQMPGVVEGVYYESIQIPPFVPHSKQRERRRIGLSQFGRPLSSISTLQQMLEIVFDVLEVLRYLRFKCQVLHRDISKGNVVYIEDETPMPDAGSVPMSDPGPSGADDAKELTLCFIKCLLGKSDDPRKTSALLIDFNRAELLEVKQDASYERISRTGTPIFIARAVQQGGPVPLKFRPVFPDPVALNPIH